MGKGWRRIRIFFFFWIRDANDVEVVMPTMEVAIGNWVCGFGFRLMALEKKEIG